MIALSDEPGLFGDCWDDALALAEWLEAHDFELCKALIAVATSLDPDTYLVDYLSRWMATDALPDGDGLRARLEAARDACFDAQTTLPGIPPESPERKIERLMESRTEPTDDDHTCTGSCYRDRCPVLWNAV